MIRVTSIALAAAACAPTGPMTGDQVAATPAPAASYTPGGPGDPIMAGCDAAKPGVLVGRTADAATQAEARRLSGAKTIRVLAPDSLATMDFRNDRLNIKTDAGGKIMSFDCS